MLNVLSLKCFLEGSKVIYSLECHSNTNDPFHNAILTVQASLSRQPHVQVEVRCLLNLTSLKIDVKAQTTTLKIAFMVTQKCSSSKLMKKMEKTFREYFITLIETSFGS